MKTTKKIAFGVVALLLSVVLAFTVAEIGLRLLKPQRTGPTQLAYDPRVGSIPVPNHRGRITLPGVYQSSVKSRRARARRSKAPTVPLS